MADKHTTEEKNQNEIHNEETSQIQWKWLYAGIILGILIGGIITFLWSSKGAMDYGWQQAMKLCVRSGGLIINGSLNLP
jgi:hypothetical protein